MTQRAALTTCLSTISNQTTERFGAKLGRNGTMSNPLRFGVIGAGQIGHVACEEILRHPDARVTAASDLDSARLERLAERFTIGERFLDPEALLTSDSVDAVYIATPNVFHAPLAIAALQNGKHVLLEKPFAMNAAEADRVVHAARESGRVFTVGMNQRFRADVQRVRALVASGSLGNVYHAKAYWLRRTGIPKLGTWFGKKSLAGGGALLDIGVHMLDLALHVTDNFRPISVSGHVQTVFGQRGLGEGGWGYSDATENGFDVEDTASALIKLENGATLALEVSWAAHQAENTRWNLELFGSDAGASCYPATLYRSGHDGDYVVQQELKGALRYPHASRFANFVNAILGREELCVTAEQALIVQRVIDAVYESSATGREVSLGGVSADARTS
jgi:predicted dehydrogenase